MSDSERREYGSGSVFQRANGRWVGTVEAGVTANGKRKRVSVSGRSKTEVRRKIRDKLADARAAGNATQPTSPRKTVHSWADDWLKIRVGQVRPNTYGTDRAAVRHYIDPVIGRTRLVDLAPKHVRQVNAAVRNAGHGEATVLRAQRVLVKMLRDALEEGYVVPASIFNIKVKKELTVRQRPKREALTVPQALAVLAHAADLPHGARYLLGFYEGMRQGEVLGLTWDAVDLNAGLISLEWQLQSLPYLDKHDHDAGFRVPHGYDVRRLSGRFHLVRPKTSTGYRVIPMAGPVRSALARLKAVRDPAPGDLLFSRDNGWPIDKAADAEEFRSLQTAANVRHPSGRPFVGHEMRNTTATLLAEAGVDPVTTTAILGHSSYAVTQGYITTRAASMRKAMDDIERLFTAPKALE